MTRIEIKEKILDVLSSFTLFKDKALNMDSYDKPAEMLDLDSLDMAQFLDEVERRFKIRVDDNVFNKGKDLEIREIVEAVYYELDK